MEETVESLLTRYNVKSGWKRYMLGDDLKTILERILTTLNEEKNPSESFQPQGELIFKAFSYFEPEDIKVMIVGQDPVPVKDNGVKATGLAFSIDCWDDEIKPDPPYKKSGHSVWKIHDSLMRAGILQTDKRYPCDHVEWAQKNILLLNVALTCGGKKPGQHLHLWEPFTKRLLQEFVQDRLRENLTYGNDGRIYVMLWGYPAQDVWRDATQNINDVATCFHVLETIHPTARTDDDLFENDKFLRDTTNHFKQIDAHFPGIFTINESLTDNNDELIVNANDSNENQILNDLHNVGQNKYGEMLTIAPGYVTPPSNSYSKTEILKLKSDKNERVPTKPYARRLHFDDRSKMHENNSVFPLSGNSSSNVFQNTYYRSFDSDENSQPQEVDNTLERSEKPCSQFRYISVDATTNSHPLRSNGSVNFLQNSFNAKRNSSLDVGQNHHPRIENSTLYPVKHPDPEIGLVDVGENSYPQFRSIKASPKIDPDKNHRPQIGYDPKDSFRNRSQDETDLLDIVGNCLTDGSRTQFRARDTLDLLYEVDTYFE